MRKIMSALAATGAIAATLTATPAAHATTTAQYCASARNWTACIEQAANGDWEARAWNNSYAGWATLLDVNGNKLADAWVPAGGGNITTFPEPNGYWACASVSRDGGPWAVCVHR
ncbi:hypothetical protein [Kribbella sp. NPDC006257]|jgi:hypothetical protein|uniref:hypothetical protein n=1 Tax=Kribbella sp. NPDC006257 TaxID=3156738 RepID=UPI0033A8E2AF